jgi:hypothetical protein
MAKNSPHGVLAAMIHDAAKAIIMQRDFKDCHDCSKFDVTRSMRFLNAYLESVAARQGKKSRRRSAGTITADDVRRFNRNDKDPLSAAKRIRGQKQNLLDMVSLKAMNKNNVELLTALAAEKKINRSNLRFKIAVPSCSVHTLQFLERELKIDPFRGLSDDNRVLNCSADLERLDFERVKWLTQEKSFRWPNDWSDQLLSKVGPNPARREAVNAFIDACVSNLNAPVPVDWRPVN